MGSASDSQPPSSVPTTGRRGRESTGGRGASVPADEEGLGHGRWRVTFLSPAPCPPPQPLQFLPPEHQPLSVPMWDGTCSRSTAVSPPPTHSSLTSDTAASPVLPAISLEPACLLKMETLAPILLLMLYNCKQYNTCTGRRSLPPYLLPRNSSCPHLVSASMHLQALLYSRQETPSNQDPWAGACESHADVAVGGFQAWLDPEVPPAAGALAPLLGTSFPPPGVA